MGLIDGVYAVAMTLIAIELPELASEVIDTIDKQVEITTISGILIYELIVYTATFLFSMSCGRSISPSSNSPGSDTSDRTLLTA